MCGTDILAGFDATQQPLEAEIAHDRGRDGNEQEKQVIDNRHVCFHANEYL